MAFTTTPIAHDIQSEAQREYGLTPDDVHDSFNFFMNTEVTLEGRASITRRTGKAGDHGRSAGAG